MQACSYPINPYCSIQWHRKSSSFVPWAVEGIQKASSTMKVTLSLLKKPYLVWKALPPRTLVSILSYRIHSSFFFPLPLAFDFEKTVPDLYTVAKVPFLIKLEGWRFRLLNIHPNLWKASKSASQHREFPLPKKQVLSRLFRKKARYLLVGQIWLVGKIPK